MHIVRKIGAIVFTALVASAAGGLASAAKVHFLFGPKLMGNHTGGQVQIGKGVACYRDGEIGPPSYLISEIGTEGVPTPKAPDIVKLRSLPKSPTMRFVYTKVPKFEFVVFNATLQQMCDPDHPPFPDWVAPCTVSYAPYEQPYGIIVSDIC